MKHITVGLVVIAAGLVLVGCETPESRTDRTASGALAGGAIGAGSGAIIGSMSGHAGEGALIGGAIGAVTGGVIGHSMDEVQRERVRAQSPQTLERIEQGQPLGLADIKALSKASLSDEVIISQIRNSRMAYHLSTAEIIDLKDTGVSEKVIDFMINTASLYSSSAVPPAARYERIIVAEPPPPPIVEEVVVAPGPGYIWIGGCWTWYSGRWVWARGHWVPPPYRGARWEPGRWERHGPRGMWYPGHWR